MFVQAISFPLVVAFAVAGWTSAADVATPTMPTAPSLELVTLVQAGPGEVQGAEITRSFCAFAYVDTDFNFSLYTGSTHVVQTPSGNMNYTCQADLLFGPGASAVEQFRDIEFWTFEIGPVDPCDIRITPGGQATVKCHQRGD